VMNKKTAVYILSLVIFVSLVVGILIGILAEHGILLIFYNTNGQLDMSIIWAALGAISTLTLGIVALIQNLNASETNKRLSEQNIKFNCYSYLKPESYVSNNSNYIYGNDIGAELNGKQILTNDGKHANKDNIEYFVKNIELFFENITDIYPDKVNVESLNFWYIENGLYSLAWHSQNEELYGFGFQTGSKSSCLKIGLLINPESKSVTEMFKKLTSINEFNINIKLSFSNPFSVTTDSTFKFLLKNIAERDGKVFYIADDPKITDCSIKYTPPVSSQKDRRRHKIHVK
jgi:uncharacterized protein YsxB (DUF464 family)